MKELEFLKSNRFLPRISWRAYFRRFCAEHGGDPFEFRDWLLFRDGWRYALAYKGPELAPANEPERRRLSVVYWKLRQAAVRRERRLLEMNMRTLEALQRDRSAPLQETLTSGEWVAGEFGQRERKVTVDHRDADFEGLRNRIDDLRHWEAECARELGGLAVASGLAAQNGALFGVDADAAR